MSANLSWFGSESSPLTARLKRSFPVSSAESRLASTFGENVDDDDVLGPGVGSGREGETRVSDWPPSSSDVGSNCEVPALSSDK